MKFGYCDAFFSENIIVVFYMWIHHEKKLHMNQVHMCIDVFSVYLSTSLHLFTQMMKHIFASIFSSIKWNLDFPGLGGQTDAFFEREDDPTRLDV